MLLDFENLRKLALEDMGKVSDMKTLEEVKIKYLGKKSELSQSAGSLKTLSVEEKKEFGKKYNSLKTEIEGLIKQKAEQLEAALEDKQSLAGALDVTLPGQVIPRGRMHVLMQTQREIIDIFERMGYSVAEGPEVETEYYNFEALNIPAGHPSRDMWSTLYLDNGLLLRTHTSPIQPRVMERLKPPLKILAPGRVYRRDAVDASHSPIFYQIEGFIVDEGITMADLKGTLNKFLHQLLGEDRKIRFRPSYFPFTEPSAEMDVECNLCRGSGCRACGGAGWLEILGAGMIDPNVFRYVNYDPEIYSGFAFGMGVDRITMLKHNIDDIRLLYENDLRFLRQF
ncbi:MAG: phenylalanine--tRNA ligase subunit alpha [bacterium]